MVTADAPSVGDDEWLPPFRLGAQGAATAGGCCRSFRRRGVGAQIGCAGRSGGGMRRRVRGERLTQQQPADHGGREGPRAGGDAQTPSALNSGPRAAW